MAKVKNKLVESFWKNGIMAKSEDEAIGVYRSLREEVMNTVNAGDLEDDDTLDELECIFANYELELDWLEYVINHRV